MMAAEVFMQHMEIAHRLGLTLMDIECLVNSEATANVAAKIGVSANGCSGVRAWQGNIRYDAAARV